MSALDVSPETVVRALIHAAEALIGAGQFSDAADVLHAATLRLRDMPDDPMEFDPEDAF